MGCEDWRPFVRPGRWNDLDMLALGPQFRSMTETAPNRLTPDEQVTHMTLWALYPSPLFLSCGLETLSDFEQRLFANEEVLAVNQDRLGACATRVRETRARRLGDGNLHHTRVHARPLANGDVAVGVCNLGDREDLAEVTADELGWTGSFAVRDLWERRDVGRHETRLRANVPPHGARLFRLRKD